MIPFDPKTNGISWFVSIGYRKIRRIEASFRLRFHIDDIATTYPPPPPLSCVAMSKPRFFGSNPFDLAFVPTKKTNLRFFLNFLMLYHYRTSSFSFNLQILGTNLLASLCFKKDLEYFLLFLFATEKFGTPLFVPLCF